METHTYTTDLAWAGSTGAGYRGYDRAHTVALGPPGTLALSADPAFRGDPALANPEQLLLAAASSCQLLSFLALAAAAHLDIVRYADAASAYMPAGAKPMRITEIVLRPQVTVRRPADGAAAVSGEGAGDGPGSDLTATVRALTARAHEQCYIASTLNAAVRIETTVAVIT